MEENLSKELKLNS